MADRLKDAFYLLRVFRSYKQGITLLSLADVLKVSERTAFRRLASLKNVGIPVYKRVIDDESYYYIKRSENDDFSDIFEYFEPVDLQQKRSITNAATEFDVKLQLVFTVVNKESKQIFTFVNAESAASYFPELAKSIFYIGGRKNSILEHENFIIYKSKLLKAKIIRSKHRDIKSKKIADTFICVECNIEKQINEFSKDKQLASGYANICKTCKNEYLRQWNKEHGKSRKEYQQEYYNSSKGKGIVLKSVQKYERSTKGKLSSSKYRASDKGQLKQLKNRFKVAKTEETKQKLVQKINNLEIKLHGKANKITPPAGMDN